MVVNRAVPSDVAALAGVDLGVAKEGLVNLATTVGGDLEVSKDGKQRTEIDRIVPGDQFCSRQGVFEGWCTGL